MESFATIGVTRAFYTYDVFVHQWPTAAIGAGWRLNQTVSMGASVAWASVGALDITYFPPGGDFLSARESTSLLPVCGYVTLRLPRIQQKRVYVSARAGSYTVITRADRPDAPEFTKGRPGLGATLGISADESRFAPLFELAYDARSTARGDLFPAGWLQLVTFSVGVRFQP